MTKIKIIVLYECNPDAPDNTNRIFASSFRKWDLYARFDGDDTELTLIDGGMRFKADPPKPKRTLWQFLKHVVGS